MMNSEHFTQPVLKNSDIIWTVNTLHNQSLKIVASYEQWKLYTTSPEK